jgi:hypothetical protein
LTVYGPSVMLPHKVQELKRERFPTSTGVLVANGVAKRRVTRVDKECDNFIRSFEVQRRGEL